jgi:hypothetical protein
MPELATPRKRGRPPKNTVVLGETVKRRRIDGDVPSSSPSTPQALEALRNATVSHTPVSRSTATRRGDRDHFARPSQGNNRVVADPENDYELLHSSLPRKANERSSHRGQSRMSRQLGDELDDTIVIIPERRRGRPQEPKTIKEGGSSRNESSENGLLAMDRSNSKGRSADTSPHRDKTQHIDTSETPTKRGRGRPRKSQITTSDAAHIHGYSENLGSNAVNGQGVGSDTAEPQGLRASVLSDRERQPTLDLDGEISTKRKRGRPRKGLAKQSERCLSPAVDEEIPEPPVEDPGLIQQVEVLKNIVLEKLTGKRDIRLVGLDDEHGKVRQLLEQTVVSGEGNSMLLIGARGSGKSMV